MGNNRELLFVLTLLANKYKRAVFNGLKRFTQTAYLAVKILSVLIKVTSNSVIIFDLLSINTPCGEDVWGNMEDKYDYTKAFSCGQIVECGDYIIEDAQNFIQSLKPKTEEC